MRSATTFRVVHRIAMALCLFVLPDTANADLGDELIPLIRAHEGEVAVVVKHLGTGELFEHRPTEPMPTASLIKLPILVEAYRQSEAGKVDLDKLIDLRQEDMVPGSGILTDHFPAGTKLSVGGAAHLMIAFSDNTATNLVLDQIGIEAVNDTMTSLGLPETRVHSKVFRRDTSIDSDRSVKYGLGSTTARDMLTILEKLHARTLVSTEASEAMLKHLAACDDKLKFPRLLPAGTKVFHKTGSVANVRTDAGLIETKGGMLVIVVLTNNNKDTSWGDNNAGDRLCSRIARTVFDHFNPPWNPPAAPTEPLKVGSSGPLVEALQRTLNAKLAGQVTLSTDGEFGSATEGALKKFQTSTNLEQTGIADAATLKAIGPLQTEADAVPDPEVVNKEQLLRAPADPLDGQPFVTCKAWAIADAKSGELQSGERHDEPIDIASTTKLMTAWIVISLADEHPEILEEVVTFTERSDNTVGSTSAIRAGESAPVREVLYGLLLPSGNDASVALAEQFGRRFADESQMKDDPLPLFVAQMNKVAGELGMSKTHFTNPHGLTDKEHKSTARDLTRLATKALTSQRFRDYVGTRQRGCTLQGPVGTSRNIVWKNTNELLGIEGYFGAKTGTTDAAGACLVSASRRGEQEQIVVVLGSAASPARYADSRNLHRWGWQQRAAGK
jgi:D-alanyl-D-alanine carboxypeptidase (penicillin-binding protein 5/6)